LKPDMVSSFVCERLQFEVARLEKITMLGVELLVYDPIDFEGIMQVTEKIVCDERETIWVANLPLIEIGQWCDD